MEKHKRPGEIVAYEGKKFTSEWYYDDAGNSQALEYAESLEEAERKKLAALFMVLGDLGQLRNKEKFRYEGDKIYAFKPKPHRFLAFFFEGAKVIVTNAFQKKTDKLPSTEKERAIRCLKDYQLRVKAGNYYGKE
ncbi:MAG: type II toxin-antitoxin system RelE/ParE family toxin [Planctomycetes bacterium]|jgi:phage-related protein|nr:type II toxin-antitoxin system RelE/ParE family toxin [Planctomycetota bacterium]